MNDIVVFKIKDKWVKGKIHDLRNEPRSYVVQCQQTGKTYVRNRFHIRPFFVNNRFRFDHANRLCPTPVKPVLSPRKHVSHDRDISSPTIHVSTTPEKSDIQISSPISRFTKKSPAKSDQEVRYMTRSGRLVNPPHKMDL